MADLRDKPEPFKPGGEYVSASALNQMVRAQLRQIVGDNATLLSRYYGDRLTLSAPGTRVPQIPQLSISDSFKFTISTGLAATMSSASTDVQVDQSLQYLNFPTDNGFLLAVNPDGSILVDGDTDYELMLVTNGAGTPNWTVVRGINGVQLATIGQGAILTLFLPNIAQLCTSLTFLDGILEYDGSRQQVNWKSPTAVVKVTSTTAGAGGYYPGVLTTYDPTEQTWTDGVAVGIMSAGTANLVTNQRYPSYFLNYDQGKALYLIPYFAGGGSVGGVNYQDCSSGVSYTFQQNDKGKLVTVNLGTNSVINLNLPDNGSGSSVLSNDWFCDIQADPRTSAKYPVLNLNTGGGSGATTKLDNIHPNTICIGLFEGIRIYCDGTDYYTTKIKHYDYSYQASLSGGSLAPGASVTLTLPHISSPTAASWDPWNMGSGVATLAVPLAGIYRITGWIEGFNFSAGSGMQTGLQIQNIPTTGNLWGTIYSTIAGFAVSMAHFDVEVYTSGGLFSPGISVKNNDPSLTLTIIGNIIVRRVSALNPQGTPFEP